MSGMLAVFSQDTEENIHPYLYQGIMGLQHRGQQGFGYAIGDDVQYGNGLLSDAVIRARKGNFGIASVKYAFTAEKKVEPLMPYRSQAGFCAIDGEPLQGMKILNDLTLDIKQTNKVIRDNPGAYALISINDDQMVVVRDAWGIKPLVFGHEDNKWYVASESCALVALGVSEIRDVQPGEVIVVNKDGMRSFLYEDSSLHPCLFEYIYIARPDSVMNGMSIYEARKQMGEALYRECPTEADIVIGAPDSGMISALGYAQASKIPYEKGIVKNRYIGRTFIDPDSIVRKQSVTIKLNAIPSVIDGKDVILVDDSIVRGTTIRRTVKILKDNGAKKVHVRVSSPPVLYEENVSIDIPHKEDLMGYGKTVEQIRESIGCDSLYFLSLEGLKEASGGGQFYTQYFNGESPFKEKE